MTFSLEIFYIFLLLPFIIKSAPPNPGISSSVDVSGTGDPCSFKGNDYSISWYYDNETTNVVFEYDQPVKTGKRWSTIGIGDNMSDMDIAVIYLDDGTTVDIIDHYSNDYVPPVKDESQDWKLTKSSSSVFDGRTKYVVERKMNTGDDKKDKTMDGCVLFQFGVNLAEYGVKSGSLKIKKHENWPDLYKACDIKEKCVKKSPVIAKAADAAVVSVPQEEIVLENKKPSLTSSGPSKCKSAGLKHTSHWNYIKANDSVEFVLNFETIQENSWSAITFGTNAKRDAFVLFTKNRKIVDAGDYVLKNFSELKKDRQQDWVIIYSNTDEETNFAKIKMSRSLVTTDKKRDRPFDNCVNIQFGINMGPYEEKENGTYKITRSNNPSEAVTMCNIRELCVANSGDEIAKDAAPEGSKISENDITGVLLGPSPNSTLPENEEEPINVNKRIDETQNNNSNIANNTQTPAVETTTLVQTSSPVVAENSPVQNPSNIPESESEDTTTQTPSNLPQTLSTQPSEILTESGSGVEITTKNNDIQTTVIQSSVESSTSSGNLKNEEAAITTTAAPSNTTIPENLTGSTPTFTTPSNEITTSPVINQETTTSIGVPLNKSAEIDTSTENTNNGQINLNNETITTSTTTVVPGSESKEFDNSNESGDLTTKLQDAPEVSTTATTTISNQIDTQQQQNNTTNNNIPQESPSTTVSIIGEVTNTTTSVNIDTTTIPQTTTLINNNNNQSIPNTSTPETINKFLASHELDNSKENKEIINQINNDNGKTNNCGDSHKDLSICDSYMNEYLNRVETWARQRNDTLDNQLWKACSLLRKVPHVPTLCCHIFNFKCGSHVTRPPTTTTTVSSLV